MRFRGGELALRIGSALVLIPVAVATAYVGSPLFALFWGAAAMGVLWEWMSLVAGSPRRSEKIVFMDQKLGFLADLIKAE